jgi:ParG
MSGKKKKLDFTVRPRVAKDKLPADADDWVQGKKVPAEEPQKRLEKPAEGPQKRLTLNLPAGLHTAFKGQCVREGVTIQDKVRHLIEREMMSSAPPTEPPQHSQ